MDPVAVKGVRGGGSGGQRRLVLPAPQGTHSGESTLMCRARIWGVPWWTCTGGMFSCAREEVYVHVTMHSKTNQGMACCPFKPRDVLV